MQSPEEWAARGRVLAGALARLIRDNRTEHGGLGLEVGCQRGDLVDQIAAETDLNWTGIDPVLDEEALTTCGAQLRPGRAEAIPFEDASFEVVVFANVFEHILPHARQQALDEIWRVLKPGGIVVGQIPNPYFPIESHSRLPFMGYLPITIQRRYWKLSRVPWEHDFFVVTLRHLRRHATASGFRVTHSAPFNYPSEAIPSSVRPFARAASPLMRVCPWSWQFVLLKPSIP